MAIIHQLIGYVGSLAITITAFLGYPGITILMAMESMIIPLPSELIMPFAGFLVYLNKFNFWLVVVFSTLGSLVGSLISYYMGKYGGERFVTRLGKYVLLDESDLKATERWFAKNGELTILIGRFIPVVRHFISIPAGIGNMKMKRFIFYTVLGACVWNSFLTYLGFLLGKNWELIKIYSKFISVPATIIIIIALVFFIYKHVLRKRKIV